MTNQIEKIKQYAEAVKQQFSTGHALEHAYRPALERLMSSFEDVHAVNDPKRSEHGNPDFIFLKDSNKNIILGYAEAKDVTQDLDKIEKTNQMHRYSGYDNLYLTDYLEFRFYQNGIKYETISIGSIIDGQIILKPDNFEQLENELQAFLELPPESIKSGKRLAQILGAKARRIRDNVAIILGDESVNSNQELEKIYKMMQSLLVHDLSIEKFADMYAQTLVYGLFVARYNDKSLNTFSRQEARDLVPKSNPFLQKFFDHIVGPDFVESLSRIVDELCEVFMVSDVHTIVHKHLKVLDDSSDKDPIIHFYEDFLKEYDPAERKKMGAYYTPIPVVQFIIRQVDEILKRDFDLPKGLADTSKTSSGTLKHANKKTYHKVQILDPAVGTATFLNEIIKHIYKDFKGQEGRWQSYVEQDLIPRLLGFELMMAPYTIAHLKLGMTLQETGVEDLSQRLNVYLTNTLEEGIKEQQDIFTTIGLADAISKEATEAGIIKDERPIMVIVGNPPYSGVSSNNTVFANGLVNKYKVEPGGVQKLQERKHWLNDDYVKFIAFAEEMISKNDSGVVAMITNNGYIDNPTFRGMRWHLTQTFDSIYVLDLHGNSKKKEVSPDGSKDENVFDIQQGVAIIVAVKKSKSIKSAKVYHAEMYGKRKDKFNKLRENIEFEQIPLDNKNLYFLPKNTEGQSQYEKGISINELFVQNVTGIVTMGDGFIINNDKKVIAERVQKLIHGDYDEATLNHDFGLGKNYAKFVLENAPKLVFDESKLTRISYRPFDTRWTYFDNRVIWRWRVNISHNFVGHNNLGLVFKIGNTESGSASIHLTQTLVDFRSWSRPGMQGGDYVAPLYVYRNDGTKFANFNPDLLKQLTQNLSNKYEPEDILDYIYAVLYSPSYREKYKEFLKIDFPRVPAPKNDKEFVSLVKYGKELRELHLMTSAVVNDYDTTFSVSGSNIIEEVKYWPTDTKTFWKGQESDAITHKAHTVTINKEQYFGNVPEVAWNFYIGGYQPAQKWLKDRKGKALTNDDIEHYQKIIKVLLETDRIMKEIDNAWSI